MASVRTLASYFHIPITKQDNTGLLSVEWQRFFLDFISDAVAGVSGTGLIARTTSSTDVGRTITAGSSKITVVNGDGDAGNPTIDVDQTVIDHDALTNFVAAEHIDWTSTTSAFSTSGTAATGALTVTGNIGVTGTVDGRDVATDGTKLDGIESGATADQSAAEIKTAYESNANTNEFSDAEQTKLAGIETAADVTDETNVVSSLDGATLTGATVATGDKVLIQDVDDSDNLKTVTAQSIADLASAATLDFELIATATASASASITFTSLTSTYFKYIIEFDQLVPATDGASLYFRTSTDNGASYDATAGDYKWAATEAADNPVTTATGSTSATEITLTSGIGSATNESGWGKVEIYNPSDTAYTHVQFQCSRLDTAGAIRCHTGDGIRLSAADVDAVQVIMSSGNITSGNFRLYGVRGS